MKLLKTAIETQRWDLAAHTLVLGAALVLDARKNGAGRNAKTEAKTRRAARKPQRA